MPGALPDCAAVGIAPEERAGRFAGWELALAGLLVACLAAGAAAESPTRRPRVVVLTDITNEPDDEPSLVRFLVFADEYDVEGLIATTSVWLKDRVRP